MTTQPPGGTIGSEWIGTGPSVTAGGNDNAFFYVQSHDMLVRATGYDQVVPASFDLGETWVNTYVPSNPANPPPATYVPPANNGTGVSTPAPVTPPSQSGNAFLCGISTWTPLFIT